MKNLFYNSKGHNTACITIHSLGKEIKLHYHLGDNPVQHHWQEFYLSSKEISTLPVNKYSLTDCEDILSKLVASVGLTIELPLTQEYLNQLHADFVKHSDSSSVWHKINTFIHIAEGALWDKFSQYNSTIQFSTDPETEHIPIKDEYKLWLTTETRWGDLLLGYGTQGKDWLDLYINDDDPLELAVQSTISSETRMFFHIHFSQLKYRENEFYKWAIKRNIPLDNINNLALGRYYLGQIIITQELLDFHPVVSDWYVPNHICKLNWNKEMIGLDTKVVNVKFFDSTMYVDSIITHAGISNV